jgi:hypothetical protein
MPTPDATPQNPPLDASPVPRPASLWEPSPAPPKDDAPDTTYEALVETPDTGDWATVHLPWHDFVVVKGGRVDPDGEHPTVSFGWGGGHGRPGSSRAQARSMRLCGAGLDSMIQPGMA